MSVNHKIRVLHLISSLGRGGKERQLAIICKHEEDSTNMIAYYNGSGTDYIGEYKLQDRIYKLSGDNYRTRLRSFLDLIKETRADILVSWGGAESFLALLASKICGVRFLNFSIQHGIRLPKLSQYFRSIICWLSPNVMANSRAGLKANNIKPGRRRFVLYNGIESSVLGTVNNDEMMTIKRGLFPSIEEHDLVFISVANFVPYKDYSTVLNALGKLKDQYGFYYLILGDGPMRPDIEKQVAALGLESRVKLMGSVENVSHYLCMADIMIHSSKGEGISNAILEGMFAGLPVIASRVGGVPETVYKEYSRLFEYEDVDALYKHLLAARTLLNSVDSMSVGYLAHLRKFDVNNMVSTYEEVVRRVIEN